MYLKQAAVFFGFCVVLLDPLLIPNFLKGPQIFKSTTF